MRQIFSAAFLSFAVVLAAPAVSAQSLSRIISNTGLSPEDFRIMGETARGLYDISSPRPGSTASWKNAESGSFGQARLDAMRGACAHVQHVVNPKGGDRRIEIRNRFCKNAAGQWVQQP